MLLGVTPAIRYRPMRNARHFSGGRVSMARNGMCITLYQIFACASMRAFTVCPEFHCMPSALRIIAVDSRRTHSLC